MRLSLIGLERSVEFPTAVRRKKIVWRDKHFVSVLFHGFEDPLHVFDCVVLRDTLADRSPRKPFIAQDLILRIDEDHCSVILVYFHRFLPITDSCSNRIRVRSLAAGF